MQHFKYPHYISAMIPGWIPWHLLWAYLVGIALIAAAISIVVNVKARLACTLLFSFVALIHVPLVMSNIFNGSNITSAFRDIGLGFGAFIIGCSFPKQE